MVNSFKFIVKTNVFEGLAGCTRERKGYQTNIKNDTKSTQNLCKIDAWKRHAQIMQNDDKIKPKWEPELMQGWEKAEQKKHAKTNLA